jgi:flavin reductase (DIM6/NTAB) family NADH-FMN oxidoreductase RutF
MHLSTVHRLQQTPLRPPVVAEATEKTFRDAMRQLAGGVCVVTAGADDERTGLTATSVTSLCADPPTLLVCVNRESSSYQALTRFRPFAVNVLAADQREVAERFGGGSALKGSQRYQGGRWLVLPSGVCGLADAAAVFECEVDERVERHTTPLSSAACAMCWSAQGRARSSAGGALMIRWDGAPMRYREQLASRRAKANRRDCIEGPSSF